MTDLPSFAAPHAFEPLPPSKEGSQHIYCPRCGATRWVRALGEPLGPCIAVASADLPSESLDAAWAEAEAALPEGSFLWGVIQAGEGRGYRAEAWRTRDDEDGDQISAEFPTPAAALRDLAAKLRVPAKEPA